MIKASDKEEFTVFLIVGEAEALRSSLEVLLSPF